MALTPLAAAADLPSVWQGDPDAAKALGIASSLIRDAAGGPIAETTGTLTVPAPGGRLLTLPGPITAVTAVTVDGSPVSDYRNVGNGLWRRNGWGCEPVPVAVTGTFGLGEVPADIVDLCVQLAVAWLHHRDEGGGSTAGLGSARLDDGAETYTGERAGQVTPVYLPATTREWLAARFGGSGAVVETL